MAKICKLVQDYAEKEARRTLYNLIQKGIISVANAAEELHISEAEILDEMQAEGFEVPKMI